MCKIQVNVGHGEQVEEEEARILMGGFHIKTNITSLNQTVNNFHDLSNKWL